MRAIALPLSCALVLAGCAHLDTQPERRITATTGTALAGITYSLPMVQYEITATRTLTECPDAIVFKKQPTGLYNGKLKIEAKAEAKTEHIAGERYRIDHIQLNGLFKTSNFAIEYQPGGSDLLKSINATVEDHSAEVIGNAVKAGLAIYAVASGPAGAVALAGAMATDAVGQTMKTQAVGVTKAQKAQALIAAAKRDSDLLTLISENSSEQVICTPEAAEMVAARVKLAAELKTLNDGDRESGVAALASLNREIERASKLASVRGLNRAGRAALTKLAVALEERLRDIEDLQTKIADLDKTLAFNGSETWPRRFDDVKAENAAALSDTQVGDLTKLLTTDKVLDAHKFAAALAELDDTTLAAYRQDAPELLDKYFDKKGKLLSFPPRRAITGCTESIKASDCARNLAALQATLDRVTSDQMKGCTDDEIAGAESDGPKNARECLSPVSPDTAKASTIPRFKRVTRARDDDPDKGLFVRPPARATLTICRPATAAEVAAKTAVAGGCAEQDLIKDDKVLAPQLGQLRYLRLKNHMFQNNGLTLSLTKDGAIEKFTYATTKSIGQGLAAAAADAATQYAAFDNARDEEKKKAAADYAASTDETANLVKEIALIKARKERQELDKPAPGPAAVDATKAATDALNLQLNYLVAQKAVIDAQVALDTARPYP